MKHAVTFIILFQVLSFMSVKHIYASDINTIKTVDSFKANGHEEQNPEWYQRFQPYEMNYALWQSAQSDENAIDVQYSFKYVLIDYTPVENRHSVYLSYTGKFDFYMGTRSSSPVINRTSNPAIHYRYDLAICGETYSWLDLSIEHRSDGQVADAGAKDNNPNSSTFGQYLAEVEYRKGNHEYFDGISNGANYFKVSPGWKFNEYGKADISLKLYFSNDSNVTWGKYAGTGARFSDFDLVRFTISDTKTFHTEHIKNMTYGLEYVIGSKGLATDSIEVYLIVPWYSKTGLWKFPFIVKSHFGPMERLSDYTKSTSTVGIGLAFAY